MHCLLCLYLHQEDVVDLTASNWDSKWRGNVNSRRELSQCSFGHGECTLAVCIWGARLLKLGLLIRSLRTWKLNKKARKVNVGISCIYALWVHCSTSSKFSMQNVFHLPCQQPWRVSENKILLQRKLGKVMSYPPLQNSWEVWLVIQLVAKEIIFIRISVMDGSICVLILRRAHRWNKQGHVNMEGRMRT